MEDQPAGRGTGQVVHSEEEAVRLHRKHGSDARVVRHCETVTMVARILVDAFRARGIEVDSKVTVAGAMLHDIGRSKIQTVRHGVEGAAIVDAEGGDRRVADIVQRHVGAGISPEEAKALGLPDLDYIPRTLEERIVCFADKMVDGDKVRPFDGEVERFIVKKHDVERLLLLRRRLGEELGEDPERIVFDKIIRTP